VGGTGDEAEPGQLVLVLPLGLIVAQGGRRPVVIDVIIKVTEGGEEGTLLGLGLIEVLILECLLIETSLQLELAGGVLALVLVLARVVFARGALVGGVLILPGAVGNEVVWVSIAIASILRTTTASAIQAVVVKPREPVDDQCQLIIRKGLQLLLYNRHQRRQGK
jgi:hypothetical protein